MSELTDFEICEEIAKTEGLNYLSQDGEVLNLEAGSYETGPFVYNPLDNDALCFRLMLKHNIVIRDRGNGCFLSTVNSYDCDTRITNKSPNKAICLAIIEANKDE